MATTMTRIFLAFVLLASGCKHAPDPSSGGTRLEYALELDPGAPTNAPEQAKEVVKRRLDALHITADVYTVGKRIHVELPGATPSSTELVKNELAIGKLEIREVDDGPRPDPLPPGMLEVNAPQPNGRTELVRLRPGGIGPGSVVDAKVRKEDDGAVVDVRLNKDGAAAFEKMSRDNLNKPIAIVLDGKVLSMPVVRTPITDGRAQITMGYGDRAKQQAEAEALVRALEAGALHGKLVLESINVVPPLR